MTLFQTRNFNSMERNGATDHSQEVLLNSCLFLDVATFVLLFFIIILHFVLFCFS